MKTARVIAITLLISLWTASPLLADVNQALESFRDGDYAAALAGFKPAAEKGDPAAQYWLGHMYAEGIGVTKDMTTAADWMTKSAKQGEVRAMRDLGGFYLQGDGVLQNYKEAHTWLEKAAYFNDPVAQRKLGQTYEKGQGVEQSKVWAHVWYDYAAKNGDNEARKLRAELAKSMSSSEVSEAQDLAQSIQGEIFNPDTSDAS